MWLIAGLGNPGDSYRHHRHNIGFNLLDCIADDYGFASWSSKHNALLNKGRIGDVEAVLCKPQSFMNCSGQPLRAVADFYQIEPGKIVVIHDELDLPLGKMRVKQGGGHGGHNGLRDIDRHIGKEYWRIRFGIDHPGHKDAVSGYVLHDFAKDELATVTRMADEIARAMPVFFAKGGEAMMSEVALRTKPL